MNLNVQTTVQTFRLITEGYILVSVEMKDKKSIIKFSYLFIERSWLDSWEYLATFPWFVYFVRKRKPFIVWCSSWQCMILFTSWWVSAYLESPTSSRGRLGWVGGGHGQSFRYFSLESSGLYKQCVPVLLPLAQIGMTGSYSLVTDCPPHQPSYHLGSFSSRETHLLINRASRVFLFIGAHFGPH